MGRVYLRVSTVATTCRHFARTSYTARRGKVDDKTIAIEIVKHIIQITCKKRVRRNILRAIEGKPKVPQSTMSFKYDYIIICCCYSCDVRVYCLYAYMDFPIYLMPFSRAFHSLHIILHTHTRTHTRCLYTRVCVYVCVYNNNRIL